MPLVTSSPYIGDTVDVVAGSDLYVYLKGKWTENVANGLYKVEFVQRVPHIVPITVQDGNTYDHEFDANGLIPEDSETLYEIGIGFYCYTNGVLAYVRLPANQYFHYLEKSGYIPSDDLSSHPYIGPFTAREYRHDRYPKLLRDYTIKNSEDRALRFYGDMPKEEVGDKMVVFMDIGKIHIVPVDTSEEKRVKNNWLDYVDKGILNVIPSWRAANWYQR